jgi:hypothetical protein
MAFTKKNKRRIVVDGHLLYWSATGNDGCISLIIMSDFEKSGKLFACFGYHQIRVPITINSCEYTSLTDQFVITPYIVRQVIQLAFLQGWNPQERGNNLYLGQIDERIDLRLNQNRVSCFKKLP